MNIIEKWRLKSFIKRIDSNEQFIWKMKRNITKVQAWIDRDRKRLCELSKLYPVEEVVHIYHQCGYPEAKEYMEREEE